MKPLSESEARKLGIGRKVTIPRTKTGKEAARKQKEADQQQFIKAAKMFGLPAPVPEYHFRIAGHRNPFRFDWAWPPEEFVKERFGVAIKKIIFRGVAVEIEGGSFRGHGHRSVGVFLSNMVKYREASIAGWCIIRVTTDEVKSGEVFNLVRRALGL